MSFEDDFRFYNDDNATLTVSIRNLHNTDVTVTERFTETTSWYDLMGTILGALRGAGYVISPELRDEIETLHQSLIFNGGTRGEK